MLATVIDQDVRAGVVVYRIEVEGGPRMLAMEHGLRPVGGADVPVVVEG